MLPKRVRHACARCRRQKLKCDNSRPCQLCVRSGFECQEATQRISNARRSVKSSRERKTPASSRATRAESSRSPPSQVNTESYTPAEDPSSRIRRDDAPERCIREAAGPSEQHERASTYQLVERLFAAKALRTKSSDAIPDGSSTEQGIPGTSNPLLALNEILGLDLPPPSVVDALLKSYTRSFHWYLTIFHEPAFRQALDPIVKSEKARHSDKPFLMLVLAVLCMGTIFIDASETTACEGYDLVQLRSRVMLTISQHTLECFDQLSIHYVAYLFILCNIYMSQRKPKLSFSILGMAIRAAQSIGLHKEASWGRIDDNERQMRRMLWWCLYMADGYSAQMFGKPSILNESDFQVSQPDDIEGTAQTCPGLQSTETREDGSIKPVTTLSYNRYKAELYLIAAPITRDMYFKSNSRLSSIMEHVKKVHRELQEWERRIPPELRVTSFAAREKDIKQDPVVRIFALQSITLQAAFDNVQLLLLRPFVGFETQSAMSEQSDLHKEVVLLSRNQCWLSSMRLSFANEHSVIVDMLQKTAPFTQWVMYSFTAGVMLGVLALSDLLSSRAEECKRGIARLIGMVKDSEYCVPMCEQTSEILTDLLHLLASQEIQALIDGRPESRSQDFVAIPSFGDASGTSHVLTTEAEATDMLSPPTQPVNSNDMYPLGYGMMESNMPSGMQDLPTHSAVTELVRNTANRFQPDFQLDENLPHTWMWDDAFSYI